MKKFWFGLAAGIAICAAAYFTLSPQLKKKEYSAGYTLGTSEGFEKGMGIGKATQKKYDDSVANVSAKKLETRVKVSKPSVKKEQATYDKNYRVYGNQIGEEIK